MASQPMPNPELPLNQILPGDCVTALRRQPADSVDLIFDDPPNKLRFQQELWRPNQTKVDAVTDAWDQFGRRAEYNQFAAN